MEIEKRYRGKVPQTLLRLTRAGASLRHRNDEGWVVKLPVSRDRMLTRLEIPIAKIVQ